MKIPQALTKQKPLIHQVLICVLLTACVSHDHAQTTAFQHKPLYPVLSIKIGHWFRRIVQLVDQENQPTDWNTPVRFCFYQAISFISIESCPDFFQYAFFCGILSSSVMVLSLNWDTVLIRIPEWIQLWNSTVVSLVFIWPKANAEIWGQTGGAQLMHSNQGKRCYGPLNQYILWRPIVTFYYDFRLQPE